MRTLSMIVALLLAGRMAGDTITFRWDANGEPEVMGYVLDWSKTAVPAGVTSRAQVANWTLSTNIAGRTTTTVSLTVPGTQLVGTNYFYLTAVTATPGLTSDLSVPVRAVKPVPVAGASLVSVTVQSTTNLALINWQDESTVPVEVPADAATKFFRAKVALVQSPLLLNAVPSRQPPKP